MAEISRATLFGKLNPLMFKSAEGAVTFCKLRGNPHVDLTHWLFQIVNLPDSDLHRILRHFEVDSARLVRDLQTMLERLPRGASAIEDFAEHLPFAVKEGWMYATLLFGESQVRSGYLLVGLLKTDRLRELLLRISREFEKVKVETLTEDFARIVKGSPEDGQAPSDGFAPGTPGEASNAIPPAAMGKQEALRRFASDLTARARAGNIDPVTGRDEEIRQVIDILMRRRQNNPILTGEAGVGKTAVAEGFALRIANGEVPPSLK
ncbi:MAG: type VI secretion system ATPase TssH, partial [Candidatus Rokuibacteriota bacterium]